MAVSCPPVRYEKALGHRTVRCGCFWRHDPGAKYAAPVGVLQ